MLRFFVGYEYSGWKGREVQANTKEEALRKLKDFTDDGNIYSEWFDAVKEDNSEEWAVTDSDIVDVNTFCDEVIEEQPSQIQPHNSSFK